MGSLVCRRCFCCSAAALRVMNRRGGASQLINPNIPLIGYETEKNEAGCCLDRSNACVCLCRIILGLVAEHCVPNMIFHLLMVCDCVPVYAPSWINPVCLMKTGSAAPAKNILLKVVVWLVSAFPPCMIPVFSWGYAMCLFDSVGDTFALSTFHVQPS